MRTFILPHTDLHPELDYHAFCHCADENTGNFYDFIPQGHSRLAVSFGNLPFTSDQPAVTIPCVQALVRGLTAGTREDLAELARELNTTLYLLGPRYLCAAWFYALIDPVRHELQYVNAGHEAPLLIRANGSVQRLERTGATLGLSVRGAHRQKTVGIDAGDILAIFSDAVSEDAVVRVGSGSSACRHGGTDAARFEEARRPGEDRTFAAVRVLGARRHPLFEDCAEESLVMCAA